MSVAVRVMRRWHLQRCFAKLGARNRSEAAGVVWTLAER